MRSSSIPLPDAASAAGPLLRSLQGALIAALLLRLLLGLLALPISAAYPRTPLEQALPIWPPSAPLLDWLQRISIEPWRRYDTIAYERIIEHGYRVEDGTAAFHPLYPGLAWLLTPLTGGNPTLALLLVSTLACAGLCLLFVRYVEQFHSPEQAGRAGMLLLLAPPACVLLLPYNESLFMLLAVGTLWAVQRQRWLLAGLLGALAALTRQQGLALGLPLLLLSIEAVWRRKAPWWALSAPVMVGLGYSLFIAYRALALGDLAALAEARTPAEFLRNLLVSSTSEEVVFGQRIAWPWEPLLAQLSLIATRAYSLDLQIDLLLGWAAVLVILFGLRRLTPAERWYSLAIMLLSLFYYNGIKSPYLSLPRHMLIAFPLFIILAYWLRGRRFQLLLLLAVLNLFLAALFVRHGWVP